ncbi:MAG: nucleotide exchange factor GrpE [Candidatus Woesearchaeota archaeon]|nr:MAG: nucleotide exchange factor GrpE [Candidatus Woesearchaeota archaeon]
MKKKQEYQETKQEIKESLTEKLSENEESNIEDIKYKEVKNSNKDIADSGLNTEKITKEQYDELINTLKRLQAEFENYKKRQEKENVQLIKNANAGLVKSLLPVLDSFELAIKNSNGNNEEIIKFKKGLEMIYAQFFSILKEQGLHVIETKGQKFDPYKHEVLLVKESEEEDDLILEEFQKGYMFNDIVLRHSKVMISKNNSRNQEMLNQEISNNS